MSKTSKPEVIKGQIYHIRFESIEELSKNPRSEYEEGRAYYCRVIADNAEDAIRKAKLVYPYEVVSSVNPYSSSSGDRDEGTIIL